MKLTIQNCNRWGKNREELLGRSLFDIPSLSGKDKQQIMNGETVHLTVEYDFDKLRSCFPTYLSGIKHFEITVSSLFNEVGKITNYLVITQDVTERVLWQRKYENLYEDAIRSQKELIESEQKMIELLRHNELVLNNANSGLAYITNDYIVQWENVSLCSRSLSYEAYKKGEFCYKTAYNRTAPCENCVMQRARKSGQVETIQFFLNNEHTIEVFANPVYNDLGEIEGVVIRVDDVTERQHMIGELERQGNKQSNLIN